MPYYLSTGLIKALRAARNDDSKVITRALDDIRREVKDTDNEVKAGAVLKGVYVSSLDSRLRDGLDC
jgi:AP-3 complex subunit delta-1